jgi:tRNA wybutosine-synthesizing protein 2
MNPFEKIISKANPALHTKLPKKWKKIGDIIILDLAELDPKQKNKVAGIYAEVLNAKTVIQKNKIAGELRKPEDIELLYGNETTTEISEYGVRYKLDLAEIMWSPGNTGWRSALSGPDKVSEFYTFDEPKVIIDYFAGIGYFSIQMAKGYPKAKVIAVDKNPKSIEYLSLNAKNNKVRNIEIINDDCRNIEAKADVIHLGYIGNTIDFLDHARNCLNEKGTVIFHESYRNNWLGFKSRSDWGSIPKKFSRLMEREGFNVKKFERVKFYGPSTSHIIAILNKN